MIDQALVHTSARELARLMRSRAVSPVEVLDAYLEVIAALNPKLNAIVTLAAGFPNHRLVYPVHLNPNVLGHVNRLLRGLANVRLIAPQGYRNFVALMARCRLVLTDSGGVQEEAPSLGKPVLVMRDTTERPEGVTAGTAILTGPNARAIVEHAARLLTDEAAYRAMATATNPYGDGHAAERYHDGGSRRVRRDGGTSPGLTNAHPSRMARRGGAS